DICGTRLAHRVQRRRFGVIRISAAPDSPIVFNAADLA
ncbi:MAG: hypothetical protein ACI88C_002919, partial [Acidimicrobiales bacterium]